jgi:CHAT domain-containing protein/Tfp pilus assembly protein PilF
MQRWVRESKSIYIPAGSAMSINIVCVLLWVSSVTVAYGGSRPEHDLNYFQASPTTNSKAGQAEVGELKQGQPIERDLVGGEAHPYRVALTSGQYVRVTIEQKGIDIAVKLFGIDGQKIIEVDYEPIVGIEWVFVIAEATGDYRLEVGSPNKDVAAGSYTIKLEELRDATSRDRHHVAAQKAFLEGAQFHEQRTGESLRKALEKYLQALPLWRSAEDPVREASTLTAIGDAYSALGDTQQALQYFNQALPLRHAARDLRRESIILNNLGRVHVERGESQKALDYFSQALILKQTIGDRKSEANTLYSMASAYMQLGELQKALEYYDRALPLTRVTREKLGESLTLSSIGSVYYKMGAWQKALDYTSQALALVRATGNRRSEAAIIHNIGTIYSQLGELQKALEYYDQALPLRRTVGDRRGEAYTLDSLGSAYLGLGESQKALDHYTQALTLARSVGDKNAEAYALCNAGAAHLRLSGVREAMDYFNQALRVSQSIGNRQGEAFSLRNLGSAYRNLKESQKAAESYTSALTLYRAIGDRNGEAATLGDMAWVEREQKHLNEALALAEAALAIIESTRQTLGSQDLRISYMTTKRGFYEFYIDLLMHMHKANPSAGHQAIALQVSERARARSLLDMLTEARADIRQGADPVLLGREQALQHQLNIKSERLTKLLGDKHTAEQALAARKELEILLGEYKEVQTQIRLKSPRYAAVTQPQPLALQEIQKQVLDENTLLLEYALGKDRSYLWAVTQTSIKSFELPGQMEIETAARRAYNLMTARNRIIKFEEPGERRARIARADREYPRAAGALSRMLLGPVANQIKGQRLVIVGDGALQYFPFAALPEPGVIKAGVGGQGSEVSKQESGVKKVTDKVISKELSPTPDSRPLLYSPLILEHEVISLPSASMLAELRKELAERKPAPKMVAVFADPVFDRKDERVKALEAKVATRGQALGKDESHGDGVITESELTRSVRDLSSDDGELLFPLPRLLFTRREAEAVIVFAPANQFKKALDFGANRAAAIDPELSQYRYVHFATHGILNTRHPELSGMVLSLIGQDGKAQDGFLLAHEVYNLKLPAELVVLSGCRTGLGKEIKGEGILSLTRGFMYAGAARVVVSLWDVNDNSTAELMAQFYKGMLGKQRLSPTAALRRAQVAMWRSARWQAPYYWAAFVLHGEYR